MIKQFKDENEGLRAKCGTLENKVVTLEQNLNFLGQFGRRNSLVLSGIPQSISDNQLENTVSSILWDIVVSMKSEEIEVCHPFGIKRPCLIRKNSAISIMICLIIMLSESCSLMKI